MGIALLDPNLSNLQRWRKRQNEAVSRYVRWWEHYPRQRTEAPYRVDFHPRTLRGRVTEQLTGKLVGEFECVDGQHVTCWVRSPHDLTRMDEWINERSTDIDFR